MTAPPLPTRPRLRLFFVILFTAAIAGPLGGVVAWRAHPAAGYVAAPPAAELYVCPMHPAVISDHPANCPICGMKLVKQAPVAASSQKKPLFYRSPMDAQQTSPVPMKDAMGMDYVAVYETEASGRSEVDGLASVTIDVTQQQLIGLRTAVVDRGVVGRSLRTVGRVSVDETRVRKVSVKVPGYVEHVFLDFLGKPVRKGQPLFALYSPEVLAAENELLVAIRTAGAAGEAGGAALVAASRRKLELWDVPESELQRLEKEGVAAKAITFVSPVNGVVTKKDIVEGARLEAGAMPYEVTDLSTVWVLAEVYEAELRFVEQGMPASLHLNAYPDRTYEGSVLFIDPVLDPKTRTVRVRTAFPNLAGDLKPELFGEVLLARKPREALRVPTDALVHSGTEHVVFVAQGEGRFAPRRVMMGEEGRDFTEILSGLSGGEAVVTRANFLIDSESSLRASLARSGSDASTAPAAPPPHPETKR